MRPRLSLFARLDDEAHELWLAYFDQGRPLELRNQLAAHYAPIPRLLARRWARRRHIIDAPLGADDFEQEAHIRMLGLIERFSLAKGVPFRSFADPQVRFNMADTRRAWDFFSRRARAVGTATKIDHLGNSSIAPAPRGEEGTQRVDDLDHAAQVFSRLPTEAMRRFAWLRFVDGVSLEQCGIDLAGFKISKRPAQQGPYHFSTMANLQREVLDRLELILGRKLPRHIDTRRAA